MSARALVVGSGVAGLTCAISLREAGIEADIWTQAVSPNITSAVAPALWYPLRKELDPRGPGWAKVSYEEFVNLAGDEFSGVILRDGIELFRDEAPSEGWWTGTPAYRRARNEHLLPGYRHAFLWERVPVIEMPVYLAYLMRRFTSLGGTVQVRVVRALPEALEHADVVVNCAGLGARELVPDPSMRGIRGQVVRVEQIGLERFILDEAGGIITYIVPRSRDIVLGGTREDGREAIEPNADTARAILERCVALEPRLADARVVSHGVGLRPGRPAVRLEAEQIAGKLVVHDYGHAGSGVTLSWGCARDVVELVQRR